MEYWTMDEIRWANHKAGLHWFEPSAMRFFHSRVGSTVYQGPGGVYFVSSEQFHDSTGRSDPRRYTVRQFMPDTGKVKTAGEFNSLSRHQAHKHAHQLADGREVRSESLP